MAQNEDNSDLFDGFGNGSLHMYVVCTPGWTPYKEGDARCMDIDFHYDDWTALFLTEHNCEETHKDESCQSYRIRNSQLLDEEFPLLTAFDDMYQDYIFEPDRAIELKRECETLKSRLDDSRAIKALRKVIYGCDKALEANCNLMFVCD